MAEREPVGRAVDLLLWLSSHPHTPWGVRAAARELGTSPSTIHRILGVFEHRGLLERDGDGGYVPGVELFRVGHAIVNQLSPARVFRRHIETLSERFDETVVLCAYSPSRGEILYLDSVYSTHPVQYVVQRGVWKNIYAGASGLAVLSFLPQEERRAIYKRGLKPLTDHTVTRPDELERIAAEIRQVGWVCTHGQSTAGAVGTAAPVFDADGNVFGNICLTIPEQRFDDDRTDEFGAAVASTAEFATLELQRLGYHRGEFARAYERAQ